MSAHEQMTQLTEKISVPTHRAAEWMQGIRPLDGMDADFFFRTQIDCGLLTEERALELRRRHLELTRREQDAASGLICLTCNGAPPKGFACRHCGAES